MPVLILTVPNVCPLDIRSVFHFSKQLNTICIFPATLNINFSTNYGGPCHMSSCSLSISFSAQSTFSLQFHKIILSISSWSFVPFDFRFFLAPLFFLWHQFLTLQMVIQFVTNYSDEYLPHKIDFSLQFLVSLNFFFLFFH